jgi:hypothetical protein
MVRRLSPWRRPRLAVAIWSHKILRWATPWLVLGALGAGLSEAANGSWLATGVVGTIILSAIAAAVGQVLASRGRRPPRLLALARALVVVNLAFGRAWLDVVRGRRIEAWNGLEWEGSSKT